MCTAPMPRTSRSLGENQGLTLELQPRLSPDESRRPRGGSPGGRRGMRSLAPGPHGGVCISSKTLPQAAFDHNSKVFMVYRVANGSS